MMLQGRSPFWKGPGQVMAIRGGHEESDTPVFKEEDLGNYKSASTTLICGKADGTKPGNHFQRLLRIRLEWLECLIWNDWNDWKQGPSIYDGKIMLDQPSGLLPTMRWQVEITSGWVENKGCCSSSVRLSTLYPMTSSEKMKCRLDKQTVRLTENWLRCQVQQVVVSSTKCCWSPATAVYPRDWYLNKLF